jgi:hypothetical protein
VFCCKAANVTALYMMPVSKKTKPRDSANFKPTLDLPDATGPSIAIETE